MLEHLAIDASRSAAAQRTGTEWYSAQIIDALLNLEIRPEITLYQRPPAVHRTLHNGQIKVIDRNRFWTHLGLSQALRRDRSDALFVPSHVIPALHPTVSVVTVHDLGYRHEPESHTRRGRAMLELATRWNARAATRIIAISEQTKIDLQQHYQVDNERIDIIHHGIDHDRFRVLDPSEYDECLANLGINKPYILFLSTIQPRKNVVRLIEAFEVLDESDLTLVLAGKHGWLSQAAIARANRSSAKIKLLGHVPDEALNALYNGASVFALPSLYEGFGMGIAEAMACGCPVVTSDRSSMPEVAGGAAVLVDPLSVESITAGLRQALEDRERLIHDGLSRARDFSWDRAARQTMQTINRAWDDVHG